MSATKEPHFRKFGGFGRGLRGRCLALAASSTLSATKADTHSSNAVRKPRTDSTTPPQLEEVAIAHPIQGGPFSDLVSR